MRTLQLCRSKLIDFTVWLLNLIAKIHYADSSRALGWRDHLRWFLEGMVSRVFSWLWDGSDEEIEAVYLGEVPLEYMSARQRAVLNLPRSHYGAHCFCGWEGFWSDCRVDDCPECGKGVYVDVPLPLVRYGQALPQLQHA